MLSWLEESYSEVDPLLFYRDLFPLGYLDKKGLMTKGKYCSIAVQIDGRKAYRYTITDELDNLDELLRSDLFTVISPCSYAGKTQRGDMMREVFAFAVDLDNTIFEDGKPVGIMSLFSQIERAEILPRPTYIVASSPKNAHLYYMFEEPIKAFAANKESLAAYKTWLTKTMWNKYVTNDYDRVQQEPISQAMRCVGSVCKNPQDGRVRAFLTGDKVSIDYLNKFSPDNAQIELSTTTKSKRYEDARPRPRFYSKPALYDWWLRQMRTGAAVGRRYFCCLCAAIFAQKAGIPQERLEQDMIDLVPHLDSLSVSNDNRFTLDDALKAIQAFDNPRYLFMRRSTLERLSGIEIPPNKRNGRKQADHLARIRKLQEFDYPNDSWRNTKGAPTKKELVQNFIKNHPDMSNSKIALELGVSRPTVIKWRKSLSDD